MTELSPFAPQSSGELGYTAYGPANLRGEHVVYDPRPQADESTDETANPVSDDVSRTVRKELEA
jgi:hypothetical protein